ncbi:MAG: hypothetical protein JO055_00935, partial [Alphaproteobacteria bacterium]|nr:hypothetical protein [Alphaproteobacteria bacterium]
MRSLVIGLTCPGCGLDAESVACPTCGAALMWNAARGSHCTICDHGVASTCCRECGLMINLDRPGDAAAAAQARADSAGHVLVSPGARVEDPVPPPGFLKRLLPTRFDAARWPVVIAGSLLLHASVVSAIVAGRPGPGGTTDDGGDVARNTVLVIDTGSFTLPAFAPGHEELAVASAAASQPAPSAGEPGGTDVGRVQAPDPTPDADVALRPRAIDESAKPAASTPYAAGIIVTPSMPSPRADGEDTRDAPNASEPGQGRGAALLPFDMLPLPPQVATIPDPPAPKADVAPPAPAQPAIQRTYAAPPPPSPRTAYAPRPAPRHVQPQPQPKRTWLGRFFQAGRQYSQEREGIYGDGASSTSSASAAGAAGGGGGGAGPGGGGAGGGGAGGGGAGGGGGGGGGGG